MASDKLPNLGFTDSPWLTGQLLIAMPGMPDARFSRSVIYVCSHSPSGTMGLVLNRLFGKTGFKPLLEQLNIPLSESTPDLPVHYGGPVETGRGFILHSADYNREDSIRIDDNIHLTATVEILQKIAEGAGPEKVLMTLGYTGWGAGQLEDEMKTNSWITGPADDALLFDTDLETKWERALTKIGVSPMVLSVEAGHA